MPGNQLTTTTPRPVWIIGLEYLELEMLKWFVETHIRRNIPEAVFDSEAQSGFARERIEDLLTTGQMLFRRHNTERLLQYYIFFTKNMVKAVRNQAAKIYRTDPHLFTTLTQFNVSDQSLSEYEAMWSYGGQSVSFVFLTPMPIERINAFDASEAVRYEYRVSSRDKSGMVLQTVAFTDYVWRAHLRFTDSWITNPFSVRLPTHVLPSVGSNHQLHMPYDVLSPVVANFIDKASYILDWLSSEGAPKNLSKLNYFDALRQANEWHYERTRRRNAAMCYPIHLGVTVTEVDVSSRVLDLGTPAGIDIFMAGRMAGRTNTFRAMFDRERGQLVYPAKKEIQVTEVTEADYTLIWERDGWRVFALESHAAFVKESELMSHCIGESPRYWQMKEDDPHHYIAMTLRSPAEEGLGKATATFDYYPTRGFTQLKGYDNKSLTLGASDMFVQFLDDIARFGIEYTSPLFTKNEDEYANSMTFPKIYSSKWPDESSIATAFNGDSSVVKNYLDRGVVYPDTLGRLLNPITKSNLEQIGSFVRTAQEVEFQLRFSEEPIGGFTVVGVDEVAPLHEHQIQIMNRLLRTPEGTRGVASPEYGVPLQDLIAQDPNPCNEVEIPVSPSVVTVETGQATTIHLPDAPEGTTFRIYRNRGN